MNLFSLWGSSGASGDKAALELEEKYNPAQSLIAQAEGDSVTSTKRGITFNNAYNNIEVVRRGVDLLVNSAADVNFDVKAKLPFTSAAKIQPGRIKVLLNNRPNPYEDINSFRRKCYMDLFVEGNCFIYFDGEHLFNLPAVRMEIKSDPKTFISGYIYDGKTPFRHDEIIHIKDNSADSIYRGDSRLKSATQSISILDAMLGYQENFFENGAVPGLVLKTKDVLSQRIKDRMVAEWRAKYNPKTGGRRPVVLDGGLELDSINPGNLKDLDFKDGVTSHEERILKALGVPPVLLNSGNNANISPNLKLFYQTTVIPAIKMFLSAFEAFFAYDMKEDVSEVRALRPDLRDEASYYTGLVNNGIMLGSEARDALRLDSITEGPSASLLDYIRIPNNVAGSATGVSGEEGGAPSKPSEDA
jgi:HK97 family phage portal protein